MGREHRHPVVTIVSRQRNAGAGSAGEDVRDGTDAVDWNLGITGGDENVHKDETQRTWLDDLKVFYRERGASRRFLGREGGILRLNSQGFGSGLSCVTMRVFMTSGGTDIPVCALISHRQECLCHPNREINTLIGQYEEFRFLKSRASATKEHRATVNFSRSAWEAEST